MRGWLFASEIDDIVGAKLRLKRPEIVPPVAVRRGRRPREHGQPRNRAEVFRDHRRDARAEVAGLRIAAGIVHRQNGEHGRPRDGRSGARQSHLRHHRPPRNDANHNQKDGRGRHFHGLGRTGSEANARSSRRAPRRRRSSSTPRSRLPRAPLRARAPTVSACRARARAPSRSSRSGPAGPADSPRAPPAAPRTSSRARA